MKRKRLEPERLIPDSVATLNQPTTHSRWRLFQKSYVAVWEHTKSDGLLDLDLCSAGLNFAVN
jgi:hypothetical protein